jgi:hypothetical protein
MPALVPPMGAPRAAGDPEGFGVLDGGDHERIAGRGAVGDDQSGDGVLVGTELLDVRIVGVGAGGADDEEIAVAAAGAHPLEGGVDVGAAAHEYRAGGGGGGYVVGIADAEIGELFRGEGGNCAAEYENDGEKRCMGPPGSAIIARAAVGGQFGIPHPY